MNYLRYCRIDKAFGIFNAAILDQVFIAFNDIGYSKLMPLYNLAPAVLGLPAFNQLIRHLG